MTFVNLFLIVLVAYIYFRKLPRHFCVRGRKVCEKFLKIYIYINAYSAIF